MRSIPNKNKHLPTRPQEAPTSPKPQPLDIHDYLPTFSDNHEPLVYIENTGFDAKHFRYDQPYVMLGKSGFIVDSGYRIGYFASTWQGQPNLSFQFQDLQTMLKLAENRLADKNDYNNKQLGLWRDWQIGGTDKELIKKTPFHLCLK